MIIVNLESTTSAEDELIELAIRDPKIRPLIIAFGISLAIKRLKLTKPRKRSRAR